MASMCSTIALEWLNVADWEPQNGGLQPVRVPKVLARSMAIANRAAWQIGGRRGTAETAAQ
jgi:hypothetical protein